MLFETINPFTEKVLLRYKYLSPAEIEQKINISNNSSILLNNLDITQRISLIKNISACLMKNRNKLAKITNSK
jgi:acyl-CoA reductase-like NAD-dependent aldehyde dehydrogenase